MATVEMLLQVGDNLSAGYHDGDVIHVLRPGAYFSPAELAAWLANGTIPGGVASLTRWKRQQLKRLVLELRWIHLATMAEIAAHFGWEGEPDWQERSQNMWNQNERSYQNAVAYGIDSNWGWENLKRQLAVSVVNVSLDDIEEFRQPALDETDWRVPVVRVRGWGIPNWRNLVNAAQQALIEDPAQLWTCKRGAPIDATTYLVYSEV